MLSCAKPHEGFPSSSEKKNTIYLLMLFSVTRCGATAVTRESCFEIFAVLRAQTAGWSES